MKKILAFALFMNTMSFFLHSQTLEILSDIVSSKDDKLFLGCDYSDTLVEFSTMTSSFLIPTIQNHSSKVTWPHGEFWDVKYCADPNYDCIKPKNQWRYYNKFLLDSVSLIDSSGYMLLFADYWDLNAIKVYMLLFDSSDNHTSKLTLFYPGTRNGQLLSHICNDTIFSLEIFEEPSIFDRTYNYRIVKRKFIISSLTFKLVEMCVYHFERFVYAINYLVLPPPDGIFAKPDDWVWYFRTLEVLKNRECELFFTY